MVAAVKAAPRRGIETWVTSICDVLAGDAFCRYRGWYASRHWVKDDDPNFDRASWIADHTAMVQARKAQLEAEGWIVRIEKQNAFTLFGASGNKFSGKPDLIAHRDRHPQIGLDDGGVREYDWRVEDCKTGQKWNKDRYQVFSYMIAIPLTRQDVHADRLTGALNYKDGLVEFAPHECTKAIRDQVFGELRAIGLDLSPEKTPSEDECGMCKLSVEDCPEKGKATARAVGTTGEF